MTSPPTAGPVRASRDTLLAELAGLVGLEQLRSRELDRYSIGNDASHFLLTPDAVVVAREAAEVGVLFRTSARLGVPLTLRSGGTSLSGQGVTDGILVDVRRHFTDVTVLDGGARVRVQPGVTVRMLNARLAPYGRKFGPDPASEAACTIGGVIANNSSGMACGTTENSYRTLESMVLVLPSGTVVDTGASDADALLAAREPELHAGLLRLRDRVRGDAASVTTITAQYSMKNTMGYGLNSFLDFDRPAEVLAHLVIGSEGTLGFVAEATFRTVPLRTRAASTLLVFDDLAAANRSLPALVASGAATLELLDATSLRVGQSLADVPPAVAALDVDRQAALLLEYQSTDADQLEHLVAGAGDVLAGLPLVAAAPLTSDAAVRAQLWKLRKGLFTSVAWARPSGTTALLEDIAVPVASLADTCAELTVLFDSHGYRDSVIFGHAKDGNVHFMITDRFEGEAALGRYADFTEAMVDLVLGHGGSLKAEHGTGRVMAPYVRRQFGDELYEVMREVKRLVDPAGTLNPGVLLDDDPTAHLRHIKLTPPVEEEVDRCVECGYCEPVCPSRDLTMTPRQRIVARRAEQAALAAGDTALARAIDEQYDYDGLQTCAVDGMCQTACPVLINTGDLVRRLRRDEHTPVARRGWTAAARHWGAASGAGSKGLLVARALPTPVVPAVTGLNRAARAVVPTELLPLWSPELPGGGRSRSATAGPLRTAPGEEVDAVYLPACVNAMFGPVQGSRGVQWSLQELCARAGVRLLVPESVDDLCCGTPWSSKGLPEGYAAMQQRVRADVLRATRDGALPLVTDASSCTEGLLKALAGSGVTVVDAVAFVAERVLPRLPAGEKVASLAVHPTCSSHQLGLDAALLEVADAVADTVHVPVAWGCCAFAGDRGLLHPELTASATAAEAAEVVGVGAEAHASCNRTCELGMTRAVGQEYQHVLELLAAQLPD
ncbi:FAD-binding and (Fe-S)-binding domain-containing protein [Auraticoccus monumenti]|uniref:FAD-binding and (Fe-S)-binding domain-containing protein n=1 Tax=Auraticoccus monumenti TaxID=675864 RepID=UPI001E35E222|nr:FAD-binding and (Fe-S)-binding domain-containing protein [Auraticoccus monumenti]